MEEWLIVVDGTPTLRMPEGERTLRRGDVICFPPGPDGAHQLRGPGNGADPLGEPRAGDDRVPRQRQARHPPPGKIFRTADAVDYWQGE